MGNYEEFFDENGEVKDGVLENNKWLKYLVQTENSYVNTERVVSVEGISGRETLMYVMRTLDILDELLEPGECLGGMAKYVLSEVLCWSEVAKGGSRRERKKWMKAGYPLEIHNIASAEIYLDNMYGNDDFYTDLTARLIRTHGLIGQSIRGEIPVSHNGDLYRISKDSDFLEMCYAADLDPGDFFMILNECIIRAVSDEIWREVKGDTEALIERILAGDLSEFSARYRLEKLCPREINIFDEDAEYFEKAVFQKFELWYFSSALSDFDLRQIKTIFDTVLDYIGGLKDQGDGIGHISFKPLADNLYYDYEGKKHVNVYKKRIIEKYLTDASTQNVRPEFTLKNGTVFVDYVFTPVCEKLIDFCVEAERSGLLTFEKSILVLYDMFGFRKDAFDRLNNEEKYLSTMNDVRTSTKDSIIDYAVGRTVVDVGSGGGVLLDRLEKKFPEKEIIGTDISVNVIEALNAKKKKEGHKWNVVVHNFVEGVFEKNADSVIFSSILHEIYSYTEGEKGRFDLESVKIALKNAYDSLTPGGRIIIRDGIKTDSEEICRIRFKSVEGLDFFDNYKKDFKGLRDIPEEKKITEENRETLTVAGDINFLREFMYTYTWGKQSYAHEVQEQFGYLTLREYVDYLESIGAKITVAREFLEGGYPDNLSKYLDFLDEKGEPRDYPNSNCIIVAEKI